ncbi:MAG: hypothetical protein KatS3mg110_4301 [Pirellulaceae bacterium]|nr:MAG: hypothetical protein KatS3mg110_4301 [Pirellulaceae bacterium]
MRQTESRVWGAVIGLAALWVLGALLVWYSANPATRKTSLDHPVLRKSDSLAQRPLLLPAGDYAGSDACRECHDSIYEDYFSTHGMGRSLALIEKAHPIENYQHARFQTSDGRAYEVTRDGDKVVHREYMVDRSGEKLFDESVVIEFAVGSGQRGRGYLFRREGRLYQSPISWYTQRATWDLSPGYPPGQHQRFSRRISTDCLYCHAGRISVTSLDEQRFSDSPFVEMAIGCERCHGPAGEHVRRRKEGLEDDSLISIARLEPDRRDAVCWQCHLRAAQWIPHPGQTRFAWKPGDRLEQHTLVVPEQPSTATEAVESTVLQLMSSRCYTASGGRLGCISCHDPHRRLPVEARPAHYQQRCFECHDEQACRVPLVERQAAPAQGWCIHCHMPRLPVPAVPHTALTDHRILRRPQEGAGAAAAGEGHRFFREEALQIEPHLLERGRGIWQAQLSIAEGSERAKQAIGLLEPLRDRWPQDELLSFYLGMACAVAGRMPEAEATWRTLLEAGTASEDVYRFLTTLYLTQNDAARALQTARRWREHYPESPEAWFFEARAAQGMGHVSDAIRALRATIDRDPTAVAARQLLAELLAAEGRREEAATQTRWISRFLEAVRQPMR